MANAKPAPVWSTACPDWERRIEAGESLIPLPPLFPAEAEAALEVFKSLRLVDVAGSPPIGRAARAWALDFARAVFGAYDASAGRRLIREFALLIAKKNGKSTIAAGVMLTALVRNWRKSAEYYILAPTIEIANNSFFPARDMVRADPELAELLHVQEHVRKITHRATNAFLKVVAADADTVSGKKTTGLLVDEHWLFGKRANAEAMIAEAAGGLISRPEGFVVYLSTQSDEPPAGVFKAKLNYWRNVRDGKIADPRCLPVLYEFPPALLEAKAYREPAHFGLTNPNLGLSVDEEFLTDKLREAEASGQGALNIVLAKHLNVEIGQSLRDDRWAGADHWQAAADPALTLDGLIRRSEVLVAGIDGGGLDDLLALSVVGREAEKRWLAWGMAFVHLEGLRRRKSIVSVLIDFARAGELVVVDDFGVIAPDDIQSRIDSGFPASNEGEKGYAGGAAAFPPDIAELVAVVRRCDESGKLAQVGLDPAGLGLIVDGLASIGVVQAPDDQSQSRVVGVSQGWRLTGAIKTAERKLQDKTLLHAGQALLAWAVGNAKAEPRGNAIVITKQLAGAGKIDPLMALFDAIALMTQNPDAPGESVYNDVERRPGGFLVV